MSFIPIFIPLHLGQPARVNSHIKKDLETKRNNASIILFEIYEDS